MDSFKIYNISTPEDSLPTSEISEYPSVQLKYRIGQDGNLERAKSGIIKKKNIMGVFDAGGLLTCDINELFEQIMREFNKSYYTGILFDFKKTAEAFPVTEALCRLINERNIENYIPCEFAKISEKSKIIVSASVSGGSVEKLLTEKAELYGPKRICVAIIKDNRVFSMPSFENNGRNISDSELNAIISENNATSYFSSDLGSKYFTYKTENEHRFVLYDDDFTASYKISLTKKLGLCCAFIKLTEWKSSITDLLNNIK